MRCFPWLLALCLPVALVAQDPSHGHPPPHPAPASAGAAQQAGSSEAAPVASPEAKPARSAMTTPSERNRTAPPVHAAQLQLPPVAALEHIRQGVLRAQEAKAKGDPVPTPLLRPSGAGRYLAAVLVCADSDLDVPSLFGVLPKDLLVFRVPGAFASAEITALLEQAVATERLSLCIVLSHTQCKSLEAEQGTSTAAQALARRGEPARSVAQARQLALPMAHAFVEREHLLSSSESLRAAVGKDQLRIVAATADSKSQAIAWHTTRVDDLPLAPVK